jgi:integrase
MALDAQARQWSPEARQLMFPTVTGGLLKYKFFAGKVWAPTLKAAKVVFRKFHSTRHSYAAWMLSSGADVRFVADQLEGIAKSR